MMKGPTELALRAWAMMYRDKGWGLTRLKPGQKRPTDRGWTFASREPEDFRGGQNLGLMSGAISATVVGDRLAYLVCVDIDFPPALERADEFLPPTGMVDGRPGKPRSHRWYLVTNIDPRLGPRSGKARVLGGPGILRFRTPGRRSVVDFLGTGGQAVVPPSIWSKDDRSEARYWETEEFEPAVVGHRELVLCVNDLAVACGCKPHSRLRAEEVRVQERRPRRREQAEAAEMPMPTGEAARQARSYLARVRPSVEGEGGDAQLFAAACVPVRDFGLSTEEAFPLLSEYNQTSCFPPWPAWQLKHKLERADDFDGPRGGRVRRSSRRVDVRVRGCDEEIVVGVGVADPGRSYVELHPSLCAAVHAVGPDHFLSHELAGVDWAGKRVVLAPASNIASNRQQVWGEFHLTRLLRQQGASVRSARVPPRDGCLLRTYNEALEDGVPIEVVESPGTYAEADAAAERASARAKEVDRVRKRMRRRKPSPELDRAKEWLQRAGVTSVTAEVVRRAGADDLSRRILFAAQKQLRAASLSAAG